MSVNLSPIEKETIIIYNEGESTAQCATYDRKLIRSLDELCLKNADISRQNSDAGSATYLFPKQWLKVRMPRQLSEGQRKSLADRARDNFGR